MRHPVPRRPFRAMERFRDNVQDMLNEMFDAPAWDYSAPAIDVEDRGDQYRIIAEVPGLNKEDLSINVTQRAVTLQGQTSREEKIEEENYIRRERRQGSFSRTIPLPAPIKPDAASASFENGVLTVTLPRETAQQGRQLEIEG